MEDVWRESVWRQYGAALEMPGNAVRACPEELWGARDGRGPGLGSSRRGLKGPGLDFRQLKGGSA